MGKRKLRDGEAQASDDGDEGTPDSSSTDSSDDGEDTSDSAPEVSDDENGQGQSSDDEDGEAFDEVNVDFQFFDPKERDFHGLKTLLHNYLDGVQYDSSALVDAIISQPTVGTVVKSGEDEHPIAVMTVLNAQRHAAAPFMTQARDFMLARCPDTGSKDKLAKAFSSPGTGLIISERLINVPPQVAPPLVQALFDELAWAVEDEPTQEARDAFKFKRYVLLTRVYRDPLANSAEDEEAGGPSNNARGKSQKHDKGDAPAGATPVLVYVRPEDEFLQRHSSVSFTFPVEGKVVGRDELVPLRMAMLLTADKVALVRSELDKAVGNAAAA